MESAPNICKSALSNKSPSLTKFAGISLNSNKPEESWPFERYNGMECPPVINATLKGKNSDSQFTIPVTSRKELSLRKNTRTSAALT